MSNTIDEDAARASAQISSGTLHLNDDEVRMRRALEAFGDRRVQHETTPPSTDRHSPLQESAWQRTRSGAAREVAVTVVRRDHSHNRLPRPAAVELVNRVEAAETALRAERAARGQIERVLTEARAQVRELQTKLAHAELAHREALEAVQAGEKAAQAALRSMRTRLQAAEDERQAVSAALSIERAAREQAEEALRIERRAGADAGRQGASASVRGKTGATRGKPAPKPKPAARKVRKSSATKPGKSTLLASAKRAVVAGKTTRSAPQKQDRKARRLKQGARKKRWAAGAPRRVPVAARKPRG